jgi:hypothetical protein
MRNVWKGLVIGGLTGVAAGAAMDLARRGSELAGKAATSAGRLAADYGPKAADRLKTVASTGAAKIHDADLGEHVKDLGHRLAESDVTDHARDALDKAGRQGAALAQTVKDAVPAGINRNGHS